MYRISKADNLPGENLIFLSFCTDEQYAYCTNVNTLLLYPVQYTVFYQLLYIQ